MLTLNFETKEEWLKARKGRITGTGLGDITPKVRGEGKKIGFYQLAADKLTIEEEGDIDESDMERGTRLEPEALEVFAKKIGKKVDTGLKLWVRSDEQSLAVSPDGTIGKKAAVDTKCLGSARHLEAFVTQRLPSDYEMQKLEYFIVNDDLETLYFAFYDPRFISEKLKFFVLEFHRKDLEEDIKKYTEIAKQELKLIEALVAEFTF